jgi:hypothetical protein
MDLGGASLVHFKIETRTDPVRDGVVLRREIANVADLLDASRRARRGQPAGHVK